MKRIRVAHITTIDMSLRYLLLNQLASLRTSGYDVTAISAPGPNVPFLQASGITYFPAPMTRRFAPFADLRALWRLYKIMCREHFAIVHTHTPKPGLLGQIAARLAGTPIVVNTIHGFYFHDNMSIGSRRFYITMEKIAAKCSDVILSQNREDIETAIREGICSADRIEYLGNGIDLTRFDPTAYDAEARMQKRRELGLGDDELVVGFVGRLVAEKGLLELLAAAAKVLKPIPNARFLIVGPVDENKPDALRPEIAECYGVAHACVFTGLRNDMPDLYSTMDVFVLPSHREGFPRAPMEASAMAVPCIATNVRGCREAVIEGRNGLLVPPGNVEALAGGIVNLLMDAETRQQLGQGARELAKEQFDELRVFAKVRDTYEQLLKAKLGIGEPSVSTLAGVS